MNRIRVRMNKIAKMQKISCYDFDSAYEEIFDTIENAEADGNVEDINLTFEEEDWKYIINGDTEAFTIKVQSLDDDDDIIVSDGEAEVSRNEFMSLTDSNDFRDFCENIA
jgi:hypothetical protein